MKSLFIDCNAQLEPIFRAASRPDDPAIALNGAPFQPADLPRLTDGYAILLDDHTTLPTDHLVQCRSLKHVVFLGTGAASYMDVPALRAHGIEVHTIKGYGDRAVAEHTIALLWACARDVARMDREIRAGTFAPAEGVQLEGKTLGIVGLGGIGIEVARIAGGMGMDVIAWNRTPRSDAGVPLVDLDTLLGRADAISLHLTLNEETRGLIGAERLRRVKHGAIFVNTARAALVDEAALLAALADGTIRHAGLDVFHEEPLRPDHPLTRLANVTLAAHAGFLTPEASLTLMRRAIDIVKGIVA
jgi:D-3-phosphoglycerate dehydrogenase / 2-oxoglutarate reductase